MWPLKRQWRRLGQRQKGRIHTVKTKAIGYWLATLLLVFGVLSGGVAELFRLRGNVEGMVHLGYPLYFITIIGFWKVLGSIALLVPGFPRLKEWAYAGIFFNMTDAAASHAACGDAAWHVIVTLVCSRACFLGASAAKPCARSAILHKSAGPVHEAVCSAGRDLDSHS